ncbi:hypothetical protein GCM10027072_05160 [Streptomyces bullii]
MTNSTLGPGITITSSDIAAKARNRSADTMPVTPPPPHGAPLKQRRREPDQTAHMERGRCGPLVEARNAPRHCT